MKILFLILAILLPILSILLAITIGKSYKEKYKKIISKEYENKIEEFNKHQKEDYEKQKEEVRKKISEELTFELRGLLLKKTEIEKEIEIDNNNLEEKKKQLICYEEEEKQKIDKHLNELKEIRMSNADKEIAEWLESAQEAANVSALLDQIELDKEAEKLTNQIQKTKEELEEIRQDLNDAHKKKQALYEEALRAQAIKEQETFYSINLTEEAIHDIIILREVKTRLNNSVTLDKLIYDLYVAKPVLEMTRRVLAKKKPSGIYKITSKKTGLVYIGQSTDVATRWTNHVKSACGLDGVADSIFQRTLKEEGIENFTFELLEECEKSELREKEKFWIEFYESNKLGLNQKVG